MTRCLILTSDPDAVRTAYGDRMSTRAWLRRHGDGVLGTVIALGYTVELLRFPDSNPQVSVPLALATALALTQRRRAPLVSFLVVSVLNVAVTDVVGHNFDGNSVFFVAVFMINLYSLGAHAVH